mgnify:CR=1 FL=1
MRSRASQASTSYDMRRTVPALSPPAHATRTGSIHTCIRHVYARHHFSYVTHMLLKRVQDMLTGRTRFWITRTCRHSAHSHTIHTSTFHTCTRKHLASRNFPRSPQCSILHILAACIARQNKPHLVAPLPHHPRAPVPALAVPPPLLAPQSTHDSGAAGGSQPAPSVPHRPAADDHMHLPPAPSPTTTYAHNHHTHLLPGGKPSAPAAVSAQRPATNAAAHAL